MVPYRSGIDIGLRRHRDDGMRTTVTLESQRLLFVVDQDVVDIGGLADQGAGFGVGPALFEEVISDAVPEALGLADIDNLVIGVLVEVHPGRVRQVAGLVLQGFQVVREGHILSSLYLSAWD